MANLELKGQSKEFLANTKAISGLRDDVESQKVFALIEISRSLDRIATFLEKPL
ncbi:hypothetical protein J4U00_gp097 [Mycobacterium phage DyoEdafos]|uniref:Uncharacterized protein n=1 Tax=Mycobacterium phage DyoEdafos TaxID=2599860 RepID=A0A5J6THY4_9CAUD|nr:hypothetical protein J4U00_gp097 [Mycobacterium phage DyoEdafos]QFG10325.1 hypothetical protein SEA_DYOEDAFOS_97 [Mycobacterium phage DyoEdafos]